MIARIRLKYRLRALALYMSLMVMQNTIDELRLARLRRVNPPTEGA